MRTRAGLKRLLRTALAAGLIAVRPVSAGTADNGTFRFLTLSLPDGSTNAEYVARVLTANADGPVVFTITGLAPGMAYDRSEEHTSELQSQSNLVCRLLLEKKKKLCTVHIVDTLYKKHTHIV